jgi:hypothetical protein
MDSGARLALGKENVTRCGWQSMIKSVIAFRNAVACHD